MQSRIFTVVAAAVSLLTAGDALAAGTILILLVEAIRSGRTGRSIMDHILATALFVAMLAEFVLVKEASSTTFFFLLIISFVDVVSGYAFGVRRRLRKVAPVAPETVSAGG